MSARVETFLLLCRCLHRDTSPATLARLRESLSSPRVDWVELIRLANEHYVAPALYGTLGRKGLLDCPPTDARGFLGELHALNTARNDDLKRQTKDFVRRLNDAGIEPIILKGGVSLFEPAFGDPGGRMMSDLDILLPATRFEEGVAVFTAAGYWWETEPRDTDAYVLPALFRTGDVARVEIHRRLCLQRHIVSAESAFSEAVAIDVGGGRALALSPTHRVVHNVFHAHCEDHHHALGFISLKEHRDLLAMSERHGPAIDWDRIRRLMREHSLERILESYLFTAGHLLGLNVPGSPRRPIASRLHYLRCLAGIRWNVLARATRRWVGLTFPLSPYNVASFYGRSGGSIGASVRRVKYAWRLLMKHRWNISQVIKIRYADFQKNVWKTDVLRRDRVR